MKKLLKICLKLVGLLLVLWIGIAIGLNAYPHLITPNNITKPLTQDPILIADAQQLGIDYSRVNISLSPSVTGDDVKDNTNTVGTFQAPNNILVKSGLSKQQELQTVAYEFMHYFWSREPQANRTQLTQTLQDFYNHDSEFQRITQPYVGDTDTIADERDSTACTAIPPYVLTDEFNAYCNQFIPNRAILFN